MKNIFSLYSLFELLTLKKKKIFCAFIDFEKNQLHYSFLKRFPNYLSIKKIGKHIRFLFVWPRSHK
jgi:hypothetical protein